MRNSERLLVITSLVSLIGMSLTAWAEEPAGAHLKTSPGSLQVQERVVAGGPDDFMEVRHLILRGSNVEIGGKLAQIARERFNTHITASGDPIINRTQRRYMKKTYPIMYDRTRGVAAAYGMRFEDDAVNFYGLSYLLGPPPACSVVYYPPKTIDGGHGLLSRNYDFTTGTIAFVKPGPGRLPCTARPYVLELHPDEGYASIAMISYDLLTGVLDGMNSQGLMVALLADDEISSTKKIEPTGTPAVGFNEIEITRFLLDTCANVDEAKEALLSVKQYYSFIPCHYIIADATGRSFVWEFSYVRNQSYIIDGGGRVQVTTNFMHHLHPDKSNLPREPHPMGSFNRYRKVKERLAEAKAPFSLKFVKEANACVANTVAGPADSVRPPGRTLWHSMYIPEKREMMVDFYLGESQDSNDSSKTTFRRSGYKSFRLAD